MCSEMWLASVLVLCVLLVKLSSGQQPVHAECGSVQVDYPLLAGRMEGLRQQSLDSIRITVQYVTANISANVSLHSENGPIKSAVEYFQSVLMVNRFTENILAPPTCRLGASLTDCPTNDIVPSMCGPHVTIPSEHTAAFMVCNEDMSRCVPRGNAGTGVALSDYVLYVTSRQDVTCNGEPIMGYAGPCVYADNMNNQPIMGFINICPSMVRSYSAEFMKVLVRHELTHALVFLDKLLNLFPNHPNPLMTSQVDGEPVEMITTPNVVAAVREHYDCLDLNGAVMENEGGLLTQAHWESRLLFTDLMNGILYEHLASYTVVSNITLSLFADSGWYSVNYEVGLSGNQLLWGSGLGCDFVEAKCNNAYSCSPCCDEYIQCSYDVQSFGYCTKPPLHDDCSVVLPGLFCTNQLDGSNVASFIPENASIAGSKLTFNLQSICTEAGKPVEPFNVNCVGHRCVQIEGTDLVALGIEVRVRREDGSTVEEFQWCRRTDQFIHNDTVRCPPVDLACARGTVSNIDPFSDPIPPPLCHGSCETCQIPHDPTTCTSCSESKGLNGPAPSTCVDNNVICRGNTYELSEGVCRECPNGCSLCTGPLNSDCLACADPSLFRDTTNKLESPCLTSCPTSRGVVESVDLFGRKLCINVAKPSPSPSAAVVSTGVAHMIWAVSFLLTVIT